MEHFGPHFVAPSEFWGFLGATPSPGGPGTDHAKVARAAVGRGHRSGVDGLVGPVARQRILAAFHLGWAESQHHAHHRQQLLGLACADTHTHCLIRIFLDAKSCMHGPAESALHWWQRLAPAIRTGTLLDQDCSACSNQESWKRSFMISFLWWTTQSRWENPALEQETVGTGPSRRTWL